MTPFQAQPFHAERQKAYPSFFERFFSPAQCETAEILLDIEQITTILSSLEDARSGHLCSVKQAFSDL